MLPQRSQNLFGAINRDHCSQQPQCNQINLFIVGLTIAGIALKIKSQPILYTQDRKEPSSLAFKSVDNIAANRTTNVFHHRHHSFTNITNAILLPNHPVRAAHSKSYTHTQKS